MYQVSTIVIGVAAFLLLTVFLLRRHIALQGIWSVVGWLFTSVVAWWMTLAWWWQSSLAIDRPQGVMVSLAASLLAAGSFSALMHRSGQSRATERHRRRVKVAQRTIAPRSMIHALAHRRIPQVPARNGSTLLIALASMTIALPAAAQDQAPDAAIATADTSFLDRISISLGLDFATAYYFRGIPQENQGLIAQPYATIAFKAFDGTDQFKDITFSLGTWNSLHTGPTGTDGTHDSPELWYESDITASASATLFQDWTASVIYTVYTSPNDSYDTYQEVAFKLAYNDSRYLGKWSLAPYALIAFEVDDQADGGNSAFNPAASTSEGVYLEIGIAPSIAIVESETQPVSLVFPIAVGFSLDDYYEDGAGNGRGSGFGFLDVGIELSLPLQSVMPSDSGSWTLRAGPHFLWLGDDAADLGGAINGGDDFEIWWKASLGWSF